MATVVVAGSRQISRLPAEVKRRLDTMIDKDFQILRYLADRSYPNVLALGVASCGWLTLA
jgi:hypothetical protein